MTSLQPNICTGCGLEVEVFRRGRRCATCVNKAATIANKRHREKDLEDFNVREREKYHTKRKFDESLKATRKRYAEENSVEQAAYRAEWARQNRDKRRASETKYRESNPEKITAKVSHRRALRIRATVSWADKKAILSFYTEARSLTSTTGITHQVDHIVPLNSKLVCGLHCEANLQVLPRDENIAKSNLWWPDMP